LALVAGLRELEKVDAVSRRKAGARDRAAEPAAAAACITGGPIDRLVAELDVEVASSGITLVDQLDLKCIQLVFVRVKVADVVPGYGKDVIYRIEAPIDAIGPRHVSPRRYSRATACVDVGKVGRDNRDGGVGSDLRRGESRARAVEGQISVIVDVDTRICRAEEIEPPVGKDRAQQDRGARIVVAHRQDIRAKPGRSAEAVDQVRRCHPNLPLIAGSRTLTFPST
jgi:hypothetical protein